MDVQGDQALVEAEVILDRSIQMQALELAPDAIETLGKFAKGEDVNKVTPNAQVVRSSARDIIEFAGGRPETRDPRIGGGDQNLTIVIQKFGDGTTRRVDVGVPTEMEEQDPMTIAEDALKSISKAFEIPDA